MATIITSQTDESLPDASSASASKETGDSIFGDIDMANTEGSTSGGSLSNADREPAILANSSAIEHLSASSRHAWQQHRLVDGRGMLTVTPCYTCVARKKVCVPGVDGCVQCRRGEFLCVQRYAYVVSFHWVAWLAHLGGSETHSYEMLTAE